MLYVLLTVAAWALYSYTLAILSWRRPELGVVDGRLNACGSRPNCVCSCGGDAAPLSIGTEAPSEAFNRARRCVESLPRVALVTAAPGYARYECSTALFRFTDDIELLLDAAGGVIHLRSASRVGYSDLGVNRRRIEVIRENYERGGAAPP
jgi:uncharacterized protein (DUF1499 family)